MAVDVALARSLPPDSGVLRIYRWSRPTLSFGRNQPARDRYDASAARSLGVDVVRRPTGGREVLHDRELTYSVVAPLRSLGRLKDAYRTLNGALLQALRTLRVPAGFSTPDGRPPGPSAGACFGAPVDGEVEVAGRKLVGSAQARIGTSLLQHGSLLLGPPTVALAALRTPPPAGEGGAPASDVDALGPSGEGQGISLAEVLDAPVGFPDVAVSVEAAMAGVLGGAWARDTLRPEEREVAERLVVDYESPSWTWRK